MWETDRVCMRRVGSEAREAGWQRLAAPSVARGLFWRWYGRACSAPFWPDLILTLSLTLTLTLTLTLILTLTLTLTLRRS